MDAAQGSAERACSSAVPSAPPCSEKRVSPSYDETRQRYLTSVRGYAQLCGVHLGDIQMVARISAGPDQNNRERQASPAEFRSAKRPFAERHVIAGRPDGRIVERDMDRMTCVFASPGPPVFRGDHIADIDAEGVEEVWPCEARICRDASRAKVERHIADGEGQLPGLVRPREQQAIR